MLVLTTQELLEKLKLSEADGFQISIRAGILNSTKCIYKHAGLIYYFHISEDIDFKKTNGMTEDKFLENYPEGYWIFEMEI